MGVGSSKSKKPKEKKITATELEILLKISKEKCIYKLQQKKA